LDGAKAQTVEGDDEDDDEDDENDPRAAARMNLPAAR